MTSNLHSILKHQLGDENPQDDFDDLQVMTLEETLAYVQAEGTNTTEKILNLSSQLTE